MSEEVDLNQLAMLIDAALCSDKPAVKRALQNFLLVASIAEAEDSSTKNFTGFSDLMSRLADLERLVIMLKADIESMKSVTTDKWTSYPSKYSYDQYWVTNETSPWSVLTPTIDPKTMLSNYIDSKNNKGIT